MKLYLVIWPPSKQREQVIGAAEAMKAYLAAPASSFGGDAVRSAFGHFMGEPALKYPELRLRVLLSYWYYRDVDLDALFAKYFTPPYPDVFADSGAFSAMTQGVKISVGEYAAWVKRWQHLFSVYSNLDVIKDAEATLRNQRELEDRYGLTPLPTFHILEDWRYLERYIEQYPYIALGVAGMQTRTKAIMAWLTRCFKLAQGKAVYHGFGLTSWRVMSAFPWYSVDSTSWGKGFRFGRVPLFDERRRRFVEVFLGDRKTCYEHAATIRSLGFDPADFADRARNNRAKICAIAALSFMKAENHLRQRHGEIRIPEREGTPAGLNLYLVTGGGSSGNHSIDNLATSLQKTSTADGGVRLYLAEVTNGLKDIRSAIEVLDEQ